MVKLSLVEYDVLPTRIRLMVADDQNGEDKAFFDLADLIFKDSENKHCYAFTEVYDWCEDCINRGGSPVIGFIGDFGDDIPYIVWDDEDCIVEVRQLFNL